MRKEKKVKGLGNLYNGTMTLKRREWKGFRDTMYDYFRWLKCWGRLIKLSMQYPVQLVKCTFTYRWMSTYLTAAGFMDRHTLGLRGTELRICHRQFWIMLEESINILCVILGADRRLNGKSKKAKALSDKIILFDEMMPIQIMAGFPNLKGLAVQMIPVFLAGEMDQQANLPYIDAIENYGLPADVCPLPACEAGCAVRSDYPLLGKCLVSSSMPCDGSVMTTMFQDRYFNLPSYQLSPPVRFNEPEVQAYAVKDIKQCIKFIEDQTGETFDWDAYFTVMKRYNEETDYMLKKWEINSTPYPQVCGPSLALHRMFAFQIAGSLNPAFLENDKIVYDMMMKQYEKDKAADIRPRFRALVWSCPAHYYSNFSYWAQNCWGIKVLVDMECMLSHHFFNTEDKEASLIDLAKAYERMSMRSHTNGGYANVLDELWKQCKYFNANIVIMYGHVSCKTMAGLQGLFEDQARERGVHLIWVEHDLCDRRTVSRKEMRNKVNQYMKTVFRCEPLDESLVDYDDDLTW